MVANKGMVLLVGEQPAPNLLPARHEKPDNVLLVYSERTRSIADNLRKILETDGCECHSLSCDPYNIPLIEKALDKKVQNLRGVQWTFNVTGGTKAMAIAGLIVAQRKRFPVVYLQTEGHPSRLYHYEFDEREGDLVVKKVVPLEAQVNIEDFLRMHVGDYSTEKPKDKFEQAIQEAINHCKRIDEVAFCIRPRAEPALEIDFIVRCGDRFGVGEVKTSAKKAAVDQLHSVAEQRHLGTYVSKFLVSGKEMDWNNRLLARAYRMDVVEMNFKDSGTLTQDEEQQLCDVIVGRLCGKPRSV